MNHNIHGKTVLITGASGGIGEKIAYKSAEIGANLILVARRVDILSKTKRVLEQTYGVKVSIYPVDIGNMNEVQHVFQQILKEVGTIDVLINNAGFGIFEEFIETELEDIVQMFRVNVFGLMACTKAVLPTMIQQNSGHIINIASQAGKLATAKSTGYAASKHAVLGFTNSLRMELRKTNIKISAVNPGPIETNFFTIADKSGNYVKSVKKYMLQSDVVAEKIVKLMIHPKRELNLPKWMNMGSNVYNLFPNLADKLVGNLLNKK